MALCRRQERFVNLATKTKEKVCALLWTSRRVTSAGDLISVVHSKQSKQKGLRPIPLSCNKFTSMLGHWGMQQTLLSTLQIISLGDFVPRVSSKKNRQNGSNPIATNTLCQESMPIAEFHQPVE